MGEKCCFRSKRMRSVLPRNSSSSMGERCEGVEGATAKPPRRVRRRETLCVTKKFKPHGSAMRRSRGGDRKAPSSRPQTRNPLRNKKVQATWECNAKESRGRPQSPLVASADAKPLRNKKVQLVLTPKSNEIKRNQMKSKAPPHNSAARLSMSFPPSAACKFLDLPPVNLRNLHLHLTKNPFASRPPHLCGVTQISLTNIHSPFYNITVAIAANNIRKE